VVRVADFGIAKLDTAQESRMMGIQPVTSQSTGFSAQAHISTSPGIRLGTPAYIAPEQAFAKEIDARSDIYSVGVLLFEMLTGHQPFQSDTERGLCLEHLHTKPKPINSVDMQLRIEPEIEKVLLSMMAKDREGRPTSARSVIKIIDKVLSRIAPAETGQTVPLPTVLPILKRVDETIEDDSIEFTRGGIPSWVWGLISGLVVGAALAAIVVQQT
jgi:serine/threonine-protein kinase